MYDAIPAGKKQITDKEGNVKLVDLGTESVEDLRVLLDEKEAIIEDLEAEIKSLKSGKEASKPKKK